MNYKDLLLPLGLALLTMWALQYFWGDRNATNSGSAPVSGQRFIAPVNQTEAKPLNTEIDFIDEARLYPQEFTVVETDHVKAVFCNDGASLDRLEFKRNIAGRPGAFETLQPVGEHEREQRSFLIALDEKTPYFYKLIDKTVEAGETIVHYRYESTATPIIIDKKFTIFHDDYRMNLEVAISSSKAADKTVEPRLFFAAPSLVALGENDAVAGLIGDSHDKISKIAKTSIDAHAGWYAPTLFGAEDKYFIHALVSDAHHFVNRAYFKPEAANKLLVIIEGSEVKMGNSWVLSFYCGPKEDEALAAVDKRLEQTLDYSGMLAPISRFMLEILKFLYKYFLNYGLAIIVLTILIKLILLPFSLKAEKGRKKSAEFQRKLDYLRQKHKNDNAAFSREQAELLKKHGLAGMGGCIPVLLQIPLFFALSRVLSSSIELYQAPFFGWITDLSAKDPYYILPLLITISMLVTALGLDSQQRLSMMAMALMFGAFATNFAAGLALYILVSTVLGVVQTSLQRKFKMA